jgi:alpha-beta hydrolase superfamily lysophospholipase
VQAGRIAELAAADGHVLRYRVWDAAGDRQATLVMLSGIMSHSLWLAPLAERLFDAGIHVVGADRRGSGLDDVGRGDAPSAAVLVDDCNRIIDAERRGGEPLFVLGWCWGSALAIAVAHERDDVEGLVLVTPGLWPTAEVRKAAGDALARESGKPDDEPCIATPIREDMFTRGPMLDGFVRADERRLLGYTPRLAAVSAMLAVNASVRLPQLPTSTLVILADRDEATDNAATKAALSRMKKKTIELRTLPCAHGVQFERPDELAARVGGFVLTGAAASGCFPMPGR